MTPTITFCTLVRNREWVLPYFLDGIKSIDYDKSKIDILFVVNNSTDNSEKILKHFRLENKESYNSIRVKTIDMRGQPEDSRQLNRIENYHYIAKLRNDLLSMVKNTDYVFSIDSDIIIRQPEILQQLISHQKDICSALICNGFIFNPNVYFNYFNTGKYSDKTGFSSITKNVIKNMMNKNEILFESDLTGAIYLLSKKVYKHPFIKYGFTKFGEDLFFCKCAKVQRFKLYTDISLYQYHIMSKEILQKYIDNELELPYNIVVKK